VAYSPPGYLTFFEIVKKILQDYYSIVINSNPLIPSWQVSSWQGTFLIFDLNNDNASIIRKLLDIPSNTKDMEFHLERIIIDTSGNLTLMQDEFYCLGYDNNSYTFIVDMFRENEQKVTYTTQELEQFFHITKIWKIIRDLLCSTDIEQWILGHGFEKTPVSKEKWIRNENWYYLICSNKLLNNEPVFIEHKIIEKITLELIKATKNYNKVANEFAQKVLKEEIKLRAAVQLLLRILSQPPIEFLSNKNTKRKKTDLAHYIKTEAINLEFTIKNPQQDKDIVINEEKDISNKDAEAIATLVRDLHAQKR